MSSDYDYISGKYENWRSIYFDHGDGEVYPKDVSAPQIAFIQYAEPHIIITDWYEDPQEWYYLRHTIEPFAEQAYLCYENGFWHASISCSVNCCEAILKYEYLRSLPRKEANALSKKNHFSLGFFTGDRSSNLKRLKIKTKFSQKINLLNLIRIGLYHFNPQKLRKINRQGSSDIERQANPITDELVVPITAYRAYSIMEELIDHFYNEEMRRQYIEEGLADAEAIHKNASTPRIEGVSPLPKERLEAYRKKKTDFIKNQLSNEGEGA